MSLYHPQSIQGEISPISFQTLHGLCHFILYCTYGHNNSSVINFLRKISNLTPWYRFFQESNRDYLLIDLLAILILGFIALNMSRYREEIKFGPYSVARESASKLILFSAIQAFFALLYLIQDLIDPLLKCSSLNLSESEAQVCAILDLSRLTVYQCWVWFAVFFNWKLGSMNQQQGNENTEITESSSNSSIRSSLRSTTFLPSNRDIL